METPKWGDDSFWDHLKGQNSNNYGDQWMKKSMDDHLWVKQTTVDDQTTMDENVEQKKQAASF
jgi:hypothetical protein